MGFLQKLGFGLKKSSNQITSGITDIFTKKKLDSATLEELEELLISADLGVSAAARIVNEFARQKQDKDITETEIRTALAEQIRQIIAPCEQPLTFSAEKKPFVVLMIGVNGAGKTTTIGKLAAKLQAEGKQVSCIAGDTFRAAAVEQLKEWGARAKVRVFCGSPNCDSAGLCYDGLNAASKADDDVVFIDTAGRLQNKNGLMDELKKIVRVIQKIMPDAPHRILLTLDATTGQNALAQVEAFKQIIGVDGLIMTKLDGTAKGGILVAIAQAQQLPIYYIGIGEKTEDLDVFKADEFARSLLNLA